MKPGDRIGYIDTIPAKTSFKMVAAGLPPLNAFAPKMPYECPTLASIHAANKLTFTMKLNQRVWNSLDNLDREFDKFLLENSNKLFGASEADYLKKNPGAISLKRAKRLAPVDPEGRPIHDAHLSLRISGRTMEVESVQTADGPRGSYVRGVTWAPRTTPLSASATRFSMITGHTEPDEKGLTKPIVRDTLPFVDVGGGHTRFVGPGDIGQHCLVHYALIRPAYWTNVGGGFMITLSADHIIFENVASGDASGSAGGGADELRFIPDGFARDPEESGKPKDTAAYMPPTKRRITFPALVTTESQGLPEWSPASRAVEAPPQITRNITGGAGAGAGPDTSVGSSSYRVLSRSATGDVSIFGDEGEEDE